MRRETSLYVTKILEERKFEFGTIPMSYGRILKLARAPCEHVDADLFRWRFKLEISVVSHSTSCVKLDYEHIKQPTDVKKLNDVKHMKHMPRLHDFWHKGSSVEPVTMV
jgi:hypothetical protein